MRMPCQEPTPTTRRRRPGLALRHVVSLVGLSAVLLGCTGHGSLSASRDRALVIPPSHDYLDEHRRGSPSCFFGDCPQVTTYYTVERDPDHACSDLQAALEQSDVTDLQRPDPAECHFTARIDDHRLTARVTGPRGSLPPPPGSTDPVSVDRDHLAFTTVTIVARPNS